MIKLTQLRNKERAMVGFRPDQIGRQSTESDLVIVIFLRGGADGLSIVTPYADDGYYQNRVITAIPAPMSGASKRLIDLDGFFGLHPSLARLYPLYRDGQMAVVHACGSGDKTLSHFEASNTVERGQYSGQGDSSGWLSRFLDAASQSSNSAIRAVSIGSLLPASLAGSSCAVAIENIGDLLLNNPFDPHRFDLQILLHKMYSGSDLLSAAGQETLKLIDLLKHTPMQSNSGFFGYADDSLSQNLKQVASLARSDSGLSVACLDQTGYDTHVVQGGSEGILASCLKDLAVAITSFISDIGPEKWKSTRIVVMSEFGRRVKENSGGGTDHGHGNMMMVLGGSGIRGNRVYGTWSSLAGSGVDMNGNLAASTDYRNVLFEVISHQVGTSAVETVFPGLSYRPTGICYV